MTVLFLLLIIIVFMFLVRSIHKQNKEKEPVRRQEAEWRPRGDCDTAIKKAQAQTEKSAQSCAEAKRSIHSDSMMPEHERAIQAAEYIKRPIDVMSDDKEKRDAEYEIVRKEHDRLIAAIHVPEMVSPCNVELTPTEKVFLWYINGEPTSKPNIAVYWFLEYSMHDYQACIQKLFDGGYLTVASPKDSLPKLTIQQLKGILDDYALPKTGKKADLVQRIVEMIPEDAINSIYKDFLRFSYTMKGHQAVNNAYPLIHFHQNKSHIPGGFTLDDVDYLARRFPRLSPDEILMVLPALYEEAKRRGYLTMENVSLEALAEMYAKEVNGK